MGENHELAFSKIYKDFGDEKIYYEVEIESANGREGVYIMFLRDISNVLLLQMQNCDNMYKDAVLSNYSHEQLTPLNNFLNNSKILLTDLKGVKVNI